MVLLWLEAAWSRKPTDLLRRSRPRVSQEGDLAPRGAPGDLIKKHLVLFVELNSYHQVFLIHEAFTENELAEILSSVRESRELVLKLLHNIININIFSVTNIFTPFLSTIASANVPWQWIIYFEVKMLAPHSHHHNHNHDVKLMLSVKCWC